MLNVHRCRVAFTNYLFCNSPTSRCNARSTTVQSVHRSECAVTFMIQNANCSLLNSKDHHRLCKLNRKTLVLKLQVLISRVTGTVTSTWEPPSLQLLAGTEFHPSKNSTHHFCHSKKTSPTSAVCICCTHNASFTCPTTSGRRSMLTNAEKKRLPQHKHRHTHTHVVTWQQYSNAYEYSFYLAKETIDVHERLTNFLD